MFEETCVVGKALGERLAVILCVTDLIVDGLVSLGTSALTFEFVGVVAARVLTVAPSREPDAITISAFEIIRIRTGKVFSDALTFVWTWAKTLTAFFTDFGGIASSLGVTGGVAADGAFIHGIHQSSIIEANIADFANDVKEAWF